MHLRLGKWNRLQVARKADFGIYLDCGELGEILMPAKEILQPCEIGDEIDAFLYLDAEERLIATQLTPKVEVNAFAFLEVKWVNQFGAFLDWGLVKDLFCPFREQKMKMEVGNKYLVYCYIDTVTYRIVASAKIEKFLSADAPSYEVGDKVDALVTQHTDLGYKAIIDNKFMGLLYSYEVFTPLHCGDRVEAYIKNIRPDMKIDLILNKGGKQQLDGFAQRLLEYLRQQPDGFSPLNDKSPAEEIYSTFGVSKKMFKRAAGELYKNQLIKISDDGLQAL
jgi:hypothetical protein